MRDKVQLLKLQNMTGIPPKCHPAYLAQVISKVKNTSSKFRVEISISNPPLKRWMFKKLTLIKMNRKGRLKKGRSRTEVRSTLTKTIMVILNKVCTTQPTGVKLRRRFTSRATKTITEGGTVAS